MTCIFCQIVEHKKKADIVYEDDDIVAFKDANPKAMVHLLIVPKKHIKSINEIEDEDRELVSEMIFLAKKLSLQNNIAGTGYRLSFNIGRGGGQVIDHLHLHLVSGK